MSEGSDARRLWARMVSAIGFGCVTATKALEGKGTRRAQVRFDESEIRDETPIMGTYGLASRPLAGADAVLVFVNGVRSKGLIVATNDRRHQLELAEGEVALHDDQQSRVHLQRGGKVLLEATSEIRLRVGAVSLTVSAAGVAITGGKVTHEGRDIGSTHRHSNSGGSGTGGPPAP